MMLLREWSKAWCAFNTHEPRLACMAWLSLLLIVPLVMALLIDTRVVNGINIWVKPTKFAISFAVYYATLVWFFSYLPVAAIASRAGKFVIYAAIFAGLYEMAWLILAASHGVPAHFNQSRGWGAAYALAGVGAVMLIAAVLVQGIILARSARPDVHAGLKLALVIAAVMTFVLTLTIAGYLSSRGGHWVGGVKTDIGGVPVFGWSQTGGDIRVAHFWALHAHQIIALAGVLLVRVWPRGNTARRGVIIVAMLYAALTLFTSIEALQGRPFIVL
jgi:hypothetical protein